MKQNELAEKIGCSRSNLIRWARDAKISLDSLSYKPEIVRAVCSFYELHGKKKTQRAFPNVGVRSIVERYKIFEPRRVRWTDGQIIEAAKMAGLVSYKAQAKYFNRPGAHAGSVKSLWVKRFKIGNSCINGLVHWHAKGLIQNKWGFKKLYLQPLGNDRKGRPVQFRRIILWVDLEKYFKDEVPEFLKEAIHTMANFQRWLWKSENPKPLILKMIKERELPLEPA